MVYRLGQEVVLLDGTSLIGKITDGMLNDVDGELKPHYKVSLYGHEGRWYAESDIAPVASADAGGASAFAQAAQGDDTLAVALYERAVLETQLRDTEANGMTAHELYVAEQERADALERRVKELEAALLFCDTSLAAIECYVEEPSAVNATDMTVEEKMHGMLSQALAAHDVVEDALSAQRAEGDAARTGDERGRG